MNDELKPYSTSDTPLAAFLKYHSHEVVGTQQDKNDRRRVVFIFVEEPRTQELVDEFYNNIAQIEPRTYYRALKDIYRRLNNGK